MKILTRLVLRGLLAPALAGIFVFSFIFSMDRLVFIVGLMASGSIGVLAGMYLFGISLLCTVWISIPLGLLISNLSVWGKMAGLNEVIAIRTSGIRLWRLFLSSILVGLLMSLVLCLLNIDWFPRLNYLYRKTQREFLDGIPRLKIREGTIYRLGDRSLYVGEVDRDKLRNLYLFEHGSGGRGRLIYAKVGKLEQKEDSAIFRLTGGVIHEEDRDDPTRYLLARFGTYEVKIDCGEDREVSIKKRLEELSIGQLRDRIRVLRARGEDVAGIEIDLYRRLSLPFACFVFSLLGPPLGLLARSGGISISFGLSIPVVFLYYFFLILAESLGAKGLLSPCVAGFLPDAIFSLVGGYLLYRLGWR